MTKPSIQPIIILEMKSFIASILIATMLAYSTICCCGMDAHAAPVATAHGHHVADIGGHAHHRDGVDQDCQKLDVQLPAEVGVAVPGWSVPPIAFLPSAHKAVSAFDVTAATLIRGPPPWDDDAVSTQPSILLTTRRLRI